MRNVYAYSMACVIYMEIFYILESKLFAVFNQLKFYE